MASQTDRQACDEALQLQHNALEQSNSFGGTFSQQYALQAIAIGIRALVFAIKDIANRI